MFEDAQLMAPGNLDTEVLNATRRAVMSGRISPSRADTLLQRLMTWPITRVSPRYLTRQAFRLRENLTGGDALYVLVARQLEATLVTSDRRLARAPNLGVAVHYVPTG